MAKISVIIEKDDYGCYAFSPELPGCQLENNTFEVTMTNIKEAVVLYMETLLTPSSK